MSDRAIRRAAERLANKALKQDQKNQAATATAEEPKTMSAAAGASTSPNVDFAEAEEETAPPRRPLSDAQMAANRANAQKSAGPTSEAGRAKSSLNAIKTGLTGQTVLLPTDEAIPYQAHLDRHFTRHSPGNDEEHTLVQMIADSEWRILRIPGLETSIYAIGRKKLADLHPDEQDPNVRQTLIRGEILLAYRRDLTNLALQERRLRNQHKSDLAKLEALQKERQDWEKKNGKSEIQRRMLGAIHLMRHYQEHKKQFDPVQHGFEFSLPEIERCQQAIQEASDAQKPEPCLKDLLLAFRNAQKEAQAA